MVIQRVRTTPEGRDEYGDPVTGSTTTATLPGAFAAPSTTSDGTSGQPGRDLVTTELVLYAPAGTDLIDTDIITVDGTRYRIDGTVNDWTSPLTGWTPGVTAQLARAAG